jgi:hypothetical protein
MTVLRLGTAESHVLSNLDPTSSLAIGLLIVALLMVIAFEATNGFHDAANAVATVITPNRDPRSGRTRGTSQ